MTKMWVGQSTASRAGRILTGALVGLALSFTGIATAAHATDPGQLSGSGYVFDESDVLTPTEEQQVNDRLSELKSKTGMEIFVVYVDQFTNPTDPEGWANDTAVASGLGPKQFLLAVSTGGRQAYLSADTTGPLNNDEIVAAENAAIDKLHSDDWAGAPVAAADSMTSVQEKAEQSGSIFTWVLVALAGVVAVVLFMMFLQRKKKKRQVQQAHEQSLVELERAAGSALVQTDDAIKTSLDELGFARAAFGDEATAEYEQTLNDAKAHLDQAFAIKQQLDDDVPDTEEQKVAWNRQIIDLLASANQSLDEKAAKFDDLRKLEQNAPAALAAIQKLRDERTADMTDAHELWSHLQAQYAPDALATVAGNLDEAAKRLQFANEQISHAEQSVAAGDNAAAAVAIRASEDAVGQARQLQGALTTIAADLAQAATRSAALIADLQQDIITAQALPDADGRIAQVVSATQSQIQQAQAVLARTPASPLQAAQALEAANTTIDSVVKEAQDALARAERAKRQLGDTLMNAQAKVSAAEDFITTRRGAVGATARTRLAEASASISRAHDLQTADPERALSEAQRASQLADAAIQAAQNDVGAFDQSNFGGGGNDVMSAVLGGVIINSILGGGGRRGGGGGGIFGGGGGGGFGGSFGGGGGFNPGSFGGGGTRSRRGGGRF